MLRNPKKLAALAAVAALSLALAAPSGARRANNVTIKGSLNYSFSPKTIKIDKGEAVHWNWDSNDVHNVTFSSKKHSKTRKKGSYKLTFKKAGTFRYLCTVHDFHGKVVVD